VGVIIHLFSDRSRKFLGPIQPLSKEYRQLFSWR